LSTYVSALDVMSQGLRGNCLLSHIQIPGLCPYVGMGPDEKTQRSASVRMKLRYGLTDGHPQARV